MLKSFIIYWLGFIVSLFFTKQYEKHTPKKKYKRVLLFLLIVLPPAIISGFRYDVGTDYFTYAEEHHIIRNFGLKSMFTFYQEPGWFFLSYMAGTERNLFIISSLLYGIFITLAIIKMKDKIGITFPIFITYMVFYHVSFNGIRQAIACAIVLFALNYIYTEKKKYIFWIVFACLFHKTAIFAFIFLFIGDKQKKLGAWICAVMVSPFLVGLVAKVIQYVCLTLNIYTKYLETGGEGYGFILYILPSMILILFIVKAKEKVPQGSYLLLKISLLQLPLQILGTLISYADRLAEYSLIVQAVLVPLVVNSYKDVKTRRIYKMVFIGWYVLYYVIMFVLMGSNGVYPYTFKL